MNEREDKAQELEQILSERQEEADEIVSDFSKKVDELAVPVPCSPWMSINSVTVLLSP